jgi:hypothetical protein
MASARSTLGRMAPQQGAAKYWESLLIRYPWNTPLTCASTSYTEAWQVPDVLRTYLVGMSELRSCRVATSHAELCLHRHALDGSRLPKAHVVSQRQYLSLVLLLSTYTPLRD